MIQEGNLLSLYMEDEEFISEYTHVIYDKDLNHTDEVFRYDDEEDNYVGMVLRI